MPIRRSLHPHLIGAARHFPIVTLTGPRQSGKTTLCRMAFPRKRYVTLEAPDVRQYATDDPRGFLEEHRGGAILDEIQRAPALLSYLQGEVDERPAPGRFILTGSANLALLASVSQSLAGRTALLELLPLSLSELHRFPTSPTELLEVLVRGSYPAPFDRAIGTTEWYRAYVATFVERDVRQLGAVGDLAAFQVFLGLAAGRTAQLVNASALGADAGVTHTTARSWLSLLEASYLMVKLPAYQPNVRKRLVRSPKLHFLDTGLVCYLLGIRSAAQLRAHPLLGAIFETWVASELLKVRAHAAERPALSHFRDRAGAEVDLVLERGDGTVAIEAKAGRTVTGDFFSGFERARASLGARWWPETLEQVVIYGGDSRQVREQGTVLPWSRIADHPWTHGPARA